MIFTIIVFKTSVLHTRKTHVLPWRLKATELTDAQRLLVKTHDTTPC